MSDTSAVVLPQICPYAYYHDAAAAIDFLTAAFGFRERLQGLVFHEFLQITRLKFFDFVQYRLDANIATLQNLPSLLELMLVARNEA